MHFPVSFPLPSCPPPAQSIYSRIHKMNKTLKAQSNHFRVTHSPIHQPRHLSIKFTQKLPLCPPSASSLTSLPNQLSLVFPDWQSLPLFLILRLLPPSIHHRPLHCRAKLHCQFNPWPVTTPPTGLTHEILFTKFYGIEKRQRWRRERETGARLNSSIYKLAGLVPESTAPEFHFHSSVHYSIIK